jgi:isoquinoline 1-oxidoreductase subunit beta
MNAMLRDIDPDFAAILTQGLGKESESGMARRDFLRVATATGGFALAFNWSEDAAAAATKTVALPNADLQAHLTAYIHLHRDNTIGVYAKMPDMGQGIKTGFALILAEELDADWSGIRVYQAPVDAATFGSQIAGGSTSTPANWDRLRQAGASARQMIITAAAAKWKVPVTEITTGNSKVMHAASKRSATYGSLVDALIGQPLPDAKTVPLKSRKDWKLLGKRTTGVDNPAVVTGQPLYGIDTVVPNMLYASLERCPARGGKPVSANLDEILKLPGITHAFLLDGGGPWPAIMTSQNPAGVAIVGRSTWAVFSARKQLKVQWDETNAAKDSWSAMVASAKSMADKPGEKILRESGNVDAAFASAAQTVSAFYQYSHASHAQLEPENAVAHWQDGKVEIWAPTQAPDMALGSVSATLGIKPADVTIHVTRIGGGFGRKLVNDFVCEAAAISKQVNAPVKLQWTREDDMTNDFYRSGGFHALKAALNDKGQISAWQNHFMTVSQDGKSAVIGGALNGTEFPATFVPSYRAWQTLMSVKVPFGPWRAPASNVIAFATQSFMHELSVAAKRDHVEFLLEQFANQQPNSPIAGPGGPMGRGIEPARAAAVIKLAAEKAGWGKPLPAGQALGLAFQFAHAGHFAEVARISVTADRKITVHEVTVVGDIGPVVNLSAAENQCQGAVVDGLSAMMNQEITIENGRVQQTNFDKYPLLRITSAPPLINVHFIQTDVAPSGCGEPALPPLAPAVCNAIYTLMGHRVRQLPLVKEGFSI